MYFSIYGATRNGGLELSPGGGLQGVREWNKGLFLDNLEHVRLDQDETRKRKDGDRIGSTEHAILHKCGNVLHKKKNFSGLLSRSCYKLQLLNNTSYMSSTCRKCAYESEQIGVRDLVAHLHSCETVLYWRNILVFDSYS